MRFSCQERLHTKFGNSRRETQARKPLKNEKYETWFHGEKTRLLMAEVSFLIAKTAMCKRSLSWHVLFRSNLDLSAPLKWRLQSCYIIFENAEVESSCTPNPDLPLYSTKEHVH